jgi:hypothetical protein
LIVNDIVLGHGRLQRRRQRRVSSTPLAALRAVGD